MQRLKLDKILICAAGGYVTNEAGELLVIFRRGIWDLPKGKMERNERPYEVALREVFEETGIKDAAFAGEIGAAHFFDTYHSYKIGDQWKVKQTHWFKMTTKQTDFAPQLEEGIKEIKFVNALDFIETEKNIHENIRTLILVANA